MRKTESCSVEKVKLRWKAVMRSLVEGGGKRGEEREGKKEASVEGEGEEGGKKELWWLEEGGEGRQGSPMRDQSLLLLSNSSLQVVKMDEYMRRRMDGWMDG